jgi:tetratricopeptide (TPR) repeat protein
LGGLPLALAHAGSYIHGTTTTVDDYIKSYQEAWKELFDNRTTRLKDYPRSVISTYAISYEYVQRIDPGAARMLDLFAYLDHSDLWHSLFTPVLGGSIVPVEILPDWFLEDVCTEPNFTQKIRTLLDYSLIETRLETLSYAVHPVVHDWCFHMGLASHGEIAPMAVSIIGSACFSIGESADWLYRKRLARHCSRIYIWVEKDSEDMSGYDRWEHFLNSAYLSIGIFLSNQDQLVEAGAMYQQAWKGYEKALGPEHTSTLSTVNNLGNLYRDQGKLAEAEEMYLRALKGKEKALGPEHTSTLSTVSNLGSLYRDQGKLAEDGAMYLRALKGYEKALGPEHRSACGTAYNLGLLYRSWNCHAESKVYFQQAFTGYSRVLGTEHPKTIDAEKLLRLSEESIVMLEKEDSV